MTIDYDAVLEEALALSESYARDSHANKARLETVLPYIASVVRDYGEKPLAFDRWPLASDEPAMEKRRLS